MKKLTDKWLHFIAIYTGNIREASDGAGISYSYARKMVATDSTIIEAIRNRNAETITPGVATREDRQQFWTDVYNDPRQDMKDRLRASELLGKSEKDFVDRVEQSGPDGGAVKHDVNVTFVRPGDIEKKK